MEDREGKRSLSARLVGRLEEFLSWPLLDRVIALIFFLEAAAVLDAAFLPLIARTPGEGPRPNPQVAAEAVRWCIFFALTNPVLAVLGLWERRREQGHGWYYGLTSLATTFQLFYYIYLAGFQSTAVLSLAGAIAVVRLVLDRPLGLVTLAGSLAGLASLTVLTAEGLLPYAPLLIDESGGSFAQTPFLGWTSTLLVATQLVVQFAVVDFVTTRMWRAIENLRDANESLRKTQAALVRAESLAAVGSLVTGAAHELRNPLGSSSGLFQSLREEIRSSAHLPEEERKEYLELLDRALRGQGRAGAIVERLYRLTDDLETRGSEAILGDFLDSLRRDYPLLTIDASQAARALKVRQSVFKTLLPNLLDNALSSGSPTPPALAIRAEDGAIEFSITDAGRGIPKSFQKDLFKPFATGQKTGEGHGVGLGLYIAHELATRLGGRIDLESEEGKGTRVRVRIPL